LVVGLLQHQDDLVEAVPVTQPCAGDRLFDFDTYRDLIGLRNGLFALKQIAASVRQVIALIPAGPGCLKAGSNEKSQTREAAQIPSPDN
jgi:hypothetical protein